jgi:hypothetical protein
VEELERSEHYIVAWLQPWGWGGELHRILSEEVKFKLI